MKKQLLFVLLVGLIALGCSSRSVNFDYDKSADFSSFKTYAWHEGEQSIKEEILSATSVSWTRSTSRCRRRASERSARALMCT